jgi:hypothetical protein
MYLYNERSAINRLRNVLISFLTKTHATTEEEDMIKMSFLRDELGSQDKEGGATGDDSADDANWKLMCALTYRITRKRILKNAILLMDSVIDWIDKIITNKNQVNIFDMNFKVC